MKNSIHGQQGNQGSKSTTERPSTINPSKGQTEKDRSRDLGNKDRSSK